MKNLIIIFLLASTALFAQFKEELNKPVNIKAGIINQNPSSFIFGFINPDNFKMNHSFSMSYSAFGGQGVALGIYTNSMSYQFNDQLNVEVDASLINSPYSTFGQGYADQINGVYLTRAQVNYRPAENWFISLQYLNSPTGFYNNYWNRSFFGRNGFDDF